MALRVAPSPNLSSISSLANCGPYVHIAACAQEVFKLPVRPAINNANRSYSHLARRAIGGKNMALSATVVLSGSRASIRLRSAARPSSRIGVSLGSRTLIRAA